MDYKQEVKELVEEVKTGISSTKDPECITDYMRKLDRYLPDNSPSFKTNASQENKLQNVFFQYHYARFINFLMEQVHSSWENTWTQKQHDIFDNFFLRGNLHEALIVLNRFINKTEPSYKLDKCLSLLELLLNSSCLTNLLLHQSTVNANEKFDRREPLWDEVITLLVSMPERMANKLKRNNRTTFHPSTYFSNLSSNLVSALNEICEALRSNCDCSLQFLSKLFGRCCLVGQADIVLTTLVGYTLQNYMADFIWRRLCQRLVLGIPEHCMESMVSSLLKCIPTRNLMPYFLGSSVSSNNMVRLLLTQKFLLLRVFNDDKILRNILGYLSEAEPKQKLLIDVFRSLLTVWGDKVALKYSSFDQHSYVTRALFVAAALMEKENINTYQSEFISKLMNGVSRHLQSPHQDLHRLGMVTAECLTKILDPNSPELKFQYTSDNEIVRLKALLVPAEESTDAVIEQFQKTNITVKDVNARQKEKPVVKADPGDDLDSDDDLEPYDMSNDAPVSKFKRPCYPRDCLEGIIDQSNTDRTEICLESAERLIRDASDFPPELAVEFAKVLLHLENSLSLPQFTILRHESLVAAMMRCPEQVADFLTGQFYEPNYSIRHRLDILQALAAAAQKLSQPSQSTEVNEIESNLSSRELNAPPMMEDWKIIVERRIHNKTRYFGKSQLKQPAPLTKSRFASVAGHFFFPLMKSYDIKQNTLDLMGDDSLVLGRLLYTLGSIMYCAIHAPIVPQMAKCLIDFLWNLRYHVEAYIRKAVLFCLCMTVLVIPAHMVHDELQLEFMECFQWLNDVVSNDVDEECKYLAAQTLVRFRNVLTQ